MTELLPRARHRVGLAASTPGTRTDKPPLTSRQIVAACGDVPCDRADVGACVSHREWKEAWPERADVAGYESPVVVRAVRASLRNQAWAWSVS